MSHFVGKLISIVDTKSVRYVGILGSISAETSSLVLNNVKIYGTESRVDENDSKNRVLPESGRRDSIVFKGSDVEDLQVIETDPLDAVSSDSEPKSASSDRHHSTTTPNKNSKEQSGRSDKRKGHKQSTSNNANESTENRSESPVGRESSPSEEEFDEEDFVARTQKLVLDDKPHQTFEKVYNKSSSFFDNLGDGEEEKPVRRFSSERGGRGGGRGGRGGNRGGRGGFRGGRGGGRGGRGGNHQYGNHHNDSHGSSEFVPRSSQPSRGRGGSRGGPRGGSKPKGSVESSSGADEFIPGRLA